MLQMVSGGKINF